MCTRPNEKLFLEPDSRRFIPEKIQYAFACSSPINVFGAAISTHAPSNEMKFLLPFFRGINNVSGIDILNVWGQFFHSFLASLTYK